MDSSREAFREFGILPSDVAVPQESVRCSLSTGQIIGQYLFTAVMISLGFGVGIPLAIFGPPGSAAGGVLLAAGFLGLTCFATRNDYAWIELDGPVLRARHLYTRRIVERSIGDIKEIQTHVYLLHTEAAIIMERLTGVIRAYEIRFHDGIRFRASRSDPAMAGAQELIEGVIYRMSQAGEITAVMGEYKGRPIVRRIGWKVLETE
jgi:hypothetical protein